MNSTIDKYPYLSLASLEVDLLLSSNVIHSNQKGDTIISLYYQNLSKIHPIFDDINMLVMVMILRTIIIMIIFMIITVRMIMGRIILILQMMTMTIIMIFINNRIIIMILSFECNHHQYYYIC